MGPEGARLKSTPFLIIREREREKKNCTRLTECIEVMHVVVLLSVAFRVSAFFVVLGNYVCTYTRCYRYNRRLFYV